MAGVYRSVFEACFSVYRSVYRWTQATPEGAPVMTFRVYRTDTRSIQQQRGAHRRREADVAHAGRRKSAQAHTRSPLRRV